MTAPAPRLLWLVKRRYMGQDLMIAPYGRYAEIPQRLAATSDTLILCLDYEGGAFQRRDHDNGTVIESYPLRSLPRLIARATRWARHQPDTVIIGGSDSPYGILAQAVASLSGRPYLVDHYDDYSTFASARLPLMSGLTARSMRRANGLVAFDARLAADLQAQFGQDVHVVPNGIDTDRFLPRARAEARAAFDLPPEAKLIGYVGAIMSDRNMGDIFDGLRRLREQDPTVLLVLAGPLDPKVSLPTEGVRYLGVVDHGQVPDLVAACDVLTATVRLDGSARISFPVKVMEYIACEKPFLTPAEGGALDYLADFPEYLYPVGQPETLAARLTALLERREHRFPEVMTWDDAAGRFGAALRDTTADREAPCPA